MAKKSFEFEIRAELSLRVKSKAESARVRRCLNYFLGSMLAISDGAAEKRFAKRVMAMSGKKLSDAKVLKLWCEDFDERD